MPSITTAAHVAPLAHGRYRAKLKAAMKSTVKERAAKAANEAAHKLHLDDAASALQHKQRALIRGSQRAASRSRDMVATAMPLNPRLGLNRNRVAPLPMPIRADSMTLTDLTDAGENMARVLPPVLSPPPRMPRKSRRSKANAPQQPAQQMQPQPAQPQPVYGQASALPGRHAKKQAAQPGRPTRTPASSVDAALDSQWAKAGEEVDALWRSADAEVERARREPPGRDV